MRLTERDIWEQPHSIQQSLTEYRERRHPDMVSRKLIFFLYGYFGCAAENGKVGIFLTTINYNGTKEFNNCTSFSEEEKEQISLTNMYQNKIKNRREKEEKLLDNMQFRFWRTVEAVVPAKTRRRLRSRKK